MKILHCLAQLPSNTGSGVYYHTLVKGLEKRGHENALIYGIQEPFVADFSEEVKQYPVIFKTENLPFPIAGMSDEMPYESSVYSKMSEDMYERWIAKFKHSLEEAKREFNPDIIITHHIFILTSLVKEIFFDKKIIAISHGTDIRQVKKNPWIKEKYIKNVDKLNHYLSLSPKDNKELIEVFDIPKDKISIMGGGFKEEYFYEKEHKNSIIKIVYAGKMSEAKGIYEFALAIEILNKTYKDIEFIMIGNSNGDIRDRLYRNSGEARNLILKDTKKQAELADMMRDCDIFVLPSYYEGLGLIAIEALACGLRAVTTKIEGLMDLLGEEVNKSGIIEYVNLPRLYDIDKPYEEDKQKFANDLANKISKQIDRIRDDEEINIKIKNSIKAHSWEKIIDRINDIIKML